MQFVVRQTKQLHNKFLHLFHQNHCMLYQAIKLKRWLPVFFMLVIFMPMLLSVSLLVWQQIIQHQMLEQLEAENLTTIIIKKSSIHFIRVGKEIEVDGKLFDVAEISIKNDSCVLKGLYDEKEVSLLQIIKKSQQPLDNNPLHLMVTRLLSTLLFIEKKIDYQLGMLSTRVKKYLHFTTSDFVSFSPALAAPPPKFY